MNAASLVVEHEQQNHRLGITLQTPARASVCGHENPPDAAFCGECGASLATQPLNCPMCGQPNPAALKFCRGCGARQSTARVSASLPLSSLLAPSTCVAGRYHVQRLLGEGAKKRVYLAHDALLDRDVALAVFKAEGLDDDGRMRIQREITALSRLGAHPHIVTLYDAGEEHGSPYFISHYLPGGSIQDLLEKAEDHHLTLEHALRLADQICQALEHAHHQGIIHRDLKPSNVWLTHDGVVKLGDFGLATSLDHSRFSLAGVLIGTAAYLPPEQLQGHPLDARSDLYSLGAMLYEMLTGRPPFIGDGLVSLISQHLNAHPVAPSVHNRLIPSTLDALILQLLEKDPDRRPGGAATVRSLLHAIAAVNLSAPEPSSQTSTHALDRLAGEVFVGREQEMDALREQLEMTFAGHGRTVIVTGEPGIGKTRTAMELAAYARSRGARVLIGRCHNGEGTPPYWPWAHLMRAYVVERPLAALRAELGPGAATIAQVITELHNRFPDLPTPPSQEPTLARFHFFDSFTQFVKNAARNQPLILILDDLQWADTPSLLLLQFLAREIADAPLLIVMTCRDLPSGLQSPLTDALSSILRAPGSHILSLRGLSRNEVERFIEITTGNIPGEQLTAAVYEGTEGHPFFMTEVIRLLAMEGEQSLLHNTSTALPLPLPQGVRNAIEGRLAQVSESCRELLMTASVLGREFDLKMLERLHQFSPAVLLARLDEAIAARLVAPVASFAERYTFSHALVRETLYETLSLNQRSQLHKHIGAVIEQLYEGSPEAPFSELAHHFLAAAQGGDDVAKAVDYAKHAGDRALALLAYEEAVVQYERALQALALGKPDGQLRCEILLALGEAHQRTRNVKVATETYYQAATLARNLRLPAHFAHAALGAAGPWIVLLATDPRIPSLLEEALHVVPEEHRPLRAQLLARLARSLTLPESQERRTALSTEAVKLARVAADPQTLAHVLRNHHLAVWEPGNLVERLEWATEMRQYASQSGKEELLRLGHALRLADLLEKGEVTGVDEEIAAYAKCSAIAPQARTLWQWFEDRWRTMRALLDGRFAEAEQGVASAMKTYHNALQLEDNMMTVTAQTFILRREQGRLQELEIALTGAVAQHPTVPAIRSALAYLFSEIGRYEEGRREFERWAGDDFAAIPRDMLWLFSLTNLAAVCVFLGDARRAETLYTLLLPHARQNAVIAPATAYSDTVAQSLGMLTTLLERWDDAQQHFEFAIERNLQMGARPRLAHTQYQYASMLLARHYPGDQERAVKLLTQALVTAQELGMEGLAHKVKNQLAAIDRQRSIIHREEKPEGRKQETGSFSMQTHTPTPQASSYRHEGEYWTITYQDVVCRLKDVSGLHYLAHLLHHPNQEFHVMDLVHHEAGDTPSVGAKEVEFTRQWGASTGLGDAGDALDIRARTTYKQRLKELQEELGEARTFNDRGRVEKLEEEVEFLTQELAGAVGLGGRNRKAASATERARVNVTRAIKTVIKKIAEQNPALELYFSTTIKTGTFCSYTPDPRFPVTWQF